MSPDKLGETGSGSIARHHKNSMNSKFVFRQRLKESFLKEFDLAPGSKMELYRDETRDEKVFVRIDGEEEFLGVYDESISQLRSDGAPLEFVARESKVELTNRDHANNPIIQGESNNMELETDSNLSIYEQNEIILGIDLKMAVTPPSKTEFTGTPLRTQQQVALLSVLETAIAVANPGITDTQAKKRIENAKDALADISDVDESRLREMASNLDDLETSADQTTREREERLGDIKSLHQEMVTAFSEGESDN